MVDMKESTCELSHTHHYQKQSVPRLFLFLTNSIITACSKNSGDWVNLCLIS